MKKIILAIAVVLLTSGCAGSPSRLSKMNETEITSVTNDQLVICMQYKNYDTDVVYNEAVKRGLITEKEIDFIKHNQLFVGMSETALHGSWGYGHSVNKTTGDFGVHKQYVYSGSSTRKARYVYTENGKVTAWQD